MGEIKQPFCDGCKNTAGDVTYSKDGTTGVVKFKMAVWKEMGDQKEGITGDLCQTCHDKMLAWLAGKADAAATEWSTDAPEIKAITPPVI